ncbi:MAG: T9SS type A sorting domain-containing protein, partial [Bacteroidales bacterium]|nr:T9SS type A sorting domain-containing protein [Bacteroidales bacterium]
EGTTLTKAAFRYFYNAANAGNTDPRAFNVSIFPDESGLPGETATYTTTTVEVAPDENGVFIADLTDPITLDAGTYWIGFNMILEYGTAEIQGYAGQRAATDNDTPAYWRNPGDGFGTGFTTWSPDVNSVGGDPEDICFALYGSTATVDALAAMQNFVSVEKEYNFQPVLLDVTTTATTKISGTNTLQPKSLIGYNVYRNGTLIAEEIEALSYFDEGLEPGMYLYAVTAVYTEGESDPAGPLPIEITAGVPVITVSPNVLSANVMYPNTTEKTLTIGNTGNGDLMFEIWATFNSDKKAPFTHKPHTFKSAPAGTAELVSAQGTTKPVYNGGNSREMLWDNAGSIGVSTSGLISGGYGGVGATDNLVNVADDFIVPMGEQWTIEFIHTEGFTTETAPVTPTGFGVIIYSDDFGVPGDILYEEIIPWTNYDSQDLVLGMPQTMDAGHYWLSVYAWFEDGADITDHRWNWYYGVNPIEHEAVLQDQPGFFGGMDWTKIGPTGLNIDGYSMFFVIEGTSVQTDNWLSFEPQGGLVIPEESTAVTVTFDPMGILEPANTSYTGTIHVYHNDPSAPVKNIPVAMGVTSVGIGENEATYVLVYPNPSTGIMNIQANETIRTVRVMNLAGQTVVSTDVNAARYTVNASDLQTGIYFVQIETESGINTQKITVK